jgi:hypothetical protein
MSLSEFTPQDFGALADNSHDDTSAVQTAINKALTYGRNLFFPAGTYKLTTGILADLSTLGDPVAGGPPPVATTTGITIYGEGQRSKLSFQTSPAAYSGSLFVIQDNRPNPPLQNYPPPNVPPAANPYYRFHLRDLQITGSTLYSSSASTPVVQLGRQDYRDALSGCEFTNLVVNNTAVTGSTVGQAMFVGLVQNSRFEGTFTSADTNGLWISAAQYCRFLVSCTTGANGGTKAALYLTNGPNAAAAFAACNLFLNADSESTGASGSVGVLIDGSHWYNNVFVAPYFSNLATGISATAGSGNLVYSPYYNSNVTTNVGSTVGLAVDAAVLNVDSALTPAAVSAATTSEQSFAGFSALPLGADVVVSPPAITAGTGIVGARVIDATHLGITFVNATSSSLTPAAGTYRVRIIP